MSILDEARQIKDIIVNHRRYLHQNAETHLDLPVTSAYVTEKLTEMGCEPLRIGDSGITATVGGKKPGKVFLLRADMDALPIAEENDLAFKSETGNMHACGHDLHTSMLLGAAQLLKDHEDEIDGTVKLMFQPAEETLSGAKMMLDNGILENPKPDAAMMMHVGAGIPMATGTVMISHAGVCASASDWFTVNVRGRGCHGAMPEQGVDPLNVLAHIHIALQAINAREIAASDAVVLTVGEMHGGNTSNVIPESGFMAGTLRTTDEGLREKIKRRMNEIAAGIGTAFGAEAEVVFDRGCPGNTVDDGVNRNVLASVIELLGAERVLDGTGGTSINSASEDFAYISTLIPSTAVSLAAGSVDEGYTFPLHHPKVRFNEDALPIGAAVYANSALRWLSDNK